MDVRRRRMGCSIAAALLAAGFVGAWWLWLPSVVERRLVEAMDQRLGLQTQIDSVRLGLGSMRVHGWALDGHDALHFRLEEIEVPVSPFRAALQGSTAVQSAVIRGGAVRVHVGKPSFAELLSRVRGSSRARSSDEAGSARGGRSIRFAGVTVALSDEHGVLATARDVKGEASGAKQEVQAADVRVGTAPGDRAHLKQVSVRRSAGERSLSVLGGELAPAEDPGPERMIARILGLREHLRAGSAPRDSAPRSTNKDQIRISGLTIGSDPNSPLVADLTLDATRTGEGPWRLAGDGRPSGSGEMKWDLSLDAATLSAGGDIHFDSLPLSVLTPFLPRVPWHRPEHTKVSGDLHIGNATTTELSFDASVHVVDLGFSAPRLAPEPVTGVSFKVDAKGVWETEQRKLTVSQAELQTGGARATLVGEAQHKDGDYRIEARATLPPTPCADAVGAIPSDLLLQVKGFSWKGTISGSIDVDVDSTDLAAATLKPRVQDGCRFETSPPFAQLRKYREPFVHRVLEGEDAQGEPKWFEMKAGPGSNNWTTVWGMSPFFVHAVLAHEDAAFFRHSGFAPWAIEGAFRRNLKAGRYVVGASTITMQLCKNLFLHREKTLARKAQEVLLTWWVESQWDKRSILELYLNIIEYGPRVYGVTQAARYYFGREPTELSLAESAFLATILPNPRKYHGSFVRGSLHASVANKMRSLIRHMGKKNRVDATAVEHALAEVDRFAFHKPGDGPPGPRTFVGTATPLPYMGLSQLPWVTDETEPDAWDAPEPSP